MNNSRFKYFLIPVQQLAGEAKKLQPRFEQVFAAFDQKSINITELVFLVIAIICEERRPREWWMRGASEFEFKTLENSFFLQTVQALGVPFAGNSMADFFKTFRIKNLPTAVPRILHLWQTQRAKLRLVEAMSTPLEMLICQSQGERVITLSRECLLSGTLVDGRRDALEFLLHDMAHANLFFSETHTEQVTFFKALRSALRDDMPKHDPQFITALEYIMSDMNSSRPHLQQSLKAAVIEKKRRELSLPQTERLSEHVEHQLRQEWNMLF